VRFPFQEVPGPGGAVRPRPIVDVVLEGLEVAPHACLLDSGATAVRFNAELAVLCGIDLDEAPTSDLGVGGAVVTGRMAEISLTVTDGADAYTWTAPAWFCESWTPGFGLLGLTGFFDQFVVTIASYDEYVELRPINA
jgi:hypothetical protein